MRRIVARGRGGRRRGGIGPAGDPGGPDVVRAVRRRPDPRAGDRAGRGPAGGAAHRGGRRRDRRGVAHAAPARGAHARPAGRALRRRRAGAGGRLRAVATTSGAATPPSSRPRSRSRGAAGLASVPHGGELLGPAHVERGRRSARPRPARARRAGRGGPARARAGGGARVWRSRCARRRTSSWGCTPRRPRSRCARWSTPARAVALGADDPLLFGSRLVDQYEIARDVHGFTDAELAELARGVDPGEPRRRRRRAGAAAGRGRTTGWLLDTRRAQSDCINALVRLRRWRAPWPARLSSSRARRCRSSRARLVARGPWRTVGARAAVAGVDHRPNGTPVASPPPPWTALVPLPVLLALGVSGTLSGPSRGMVVAALPAVAGIATSRCTPAGS